MTDVKIEGGTLTASRTDRIVSGLLLPYGEVGRTNLGKFSIPRGTVQLPADPSVVTLNIDHDRERPVGRAVSLTDTEAGVVGMFSIANTPDGDAYLASIDDGKRRSLSAEVAEVAIRAGKALYGRLFGAAGVEVGAFPSATLMAADAGELPDYLADTESSSESTEEIVLDGVTYVRKTTSSYKTETTPKGDPPDDTEENEDMGDNATAAAGSLAAQRSGSTGPKIETPSTLFAALAEAHKKGGRTALYAALADIIPSNILGLEQPQVVGELWNGKAYQRRIVPLFNHADLTSFEVRGWRWVTKPTVAPYAGNKAPIPSNTVETEPVTIGAERIAGGHDIDRKFRDFNDEAFFAAYFAAMTESYAKVSDAQVLADVLTAAGPAIPVGAVPAGVSRVMTMIVDGALAVLNETDTMPSFAVVASNLWRDLVLTREQDKLAFLNAALGLEDGTLSNFRVVPSSALTAGQALVGARDSVTVHELGGEAPIRVEAQNVVNGGVDEGVFGYYAVNVHDADGLVLVDDGVA